MKKYILKSFLFLLLPYFTYSQAQLSNVNFKVNENDRTIEIYYDIDFNSPEDSIYINAVGGKSGILKCKTLSGDIGKGIKTGSNKLIVWDFMSDSLKINENLTINVFVKIHDYRISAGLPKTQQKETYYETKSGIVDNMADSQKSTPTKSSLPKIKLANENSHMNRASFVILGTGLAAGIGMLVMGTNKKSIALNSYKIYETSNVNQKITVTKDDWLSNYSAATIAKANKDLALANDQLKKANLLFYGGITLAALDLLYFIPKLRIGIYKEMSFHPVVNPNGVIMANMNIKF
jgi:hypothetical protein